MARLRFPRPALAGGLLLVTLVLVATHLLGWLTPVEHGVSRVLAPAQERLYSLGTWLHGIYVRPERQATAELEKENRQLTQQVNTLTIENAQLRVLSSEKTEAKALSDYLSQRGFQSIAGRVIGKNLESTVHVIIINQGSVDGVRLDQPVISGEGVLVGRVIRVQPRTAEVLLLSDSQSRVAGALQTAAQAGLQTVGVVSGDRGLSIRLELVPQSVSLSDGQVVVTSGLENGMPSGLVIGRVERVEKTDNAFFQAAALRSLIDFTTLTSVAVLRVAQ